MKKFVSAACTGLVCLSMAACGSGGGTAGTDSGSESGKKRITLAKENDVISMNTAYATDGMSFEMIAATVDGLEAMDADGNVVPALAESYDLSDDELTYTFHLRDAKSSSMKTRISTWPSRQWTTRPWKCSFRKSAPTSCPS